MYSLYFVVLIEALHINQIPLTNSLLQLKHGKTCELKLLQSEASLNRTDVEKLYSLEYLVEHSSSTYCDEEHRPVMFRNTEVTK